jgi:high-affinity Fe2+/Pb2+ permease
MTDKEQNFLKTWQIAIKMGRVKYAYTSALFFGIFTLIISTLIVYFVFEDKEVLKPVRLIFQFLGFIIAGFVLSYFFTWKKNSKKFRQLQNKN